MGWRPLRKALVGMLPRPARQAIKRALGRETDDGIASELAFWEHELSGKGDYPHVVRNCATPSLRDQVFPRHFLPFFEMVKREQAALPKVLDVGSGPMSTLTWGHDAKLFELHCVDLLAIQYQSMLLRHGIVLPVLPAPGTAESLVDQFGWQSFDISHANNSLDHTRSPRAGLVNMICVTRPGGLVLLGGRWKEGTNENWEGLHQHDLWLRGDELMHTGPDGRERSLSEDLPLDCVHRQVDDERPGAEMAIVWRVRTSGAGAPPARSPDPVT